MSNQNAVVEPQQEEDVKSKKGTDKGTEGEAPEKGPEHKDETGLFAEEDAEEEKALKWRFLAKGPALDAILAVFGAAPVEGDKQVAFRVKAAGNRELGEVFRALIQKAHANGVTLADIVKLVNSKKK